MTEHRWSDQHSYLFTMKSVNLTYNINNDDIVLENLLHLLIELFIMKYHYDCPCHCHCHCSSNIFSFSRNISSEASEASVSDGVS